MDSASQVQIPDEAVCVPLDDNSQRNTHESLFSLLSVGKIVEKFGYLALVQQPIYIFTDPSARAGYDTRSIFKRSLTGLNSEFSFS